MSCNILPQQSANMYTEASLGKGRIQVIFGPMFSGKTTELLRRIRRYQIANYNCVVVKYAKDVRYDKDGVATHDRQVLAAISAVKLTDIVDDIHDHDVIGIDEGQFFPDVVSFCDMMADRGKIVIVAALDGTFQRKGFGDILNLVPIAESVIKLTAVCMGCYKDAAYTKRKGHETKVEVIGGAEKYEASCRNCFDSPVKHKPADKENQHIGMEITSLKNEKIPLTNHTTRARRPVLSGTENLS